MAPANQGAAIDIMGATSPACSSSHWRTVAKALKPVQAIRYLGAKTAVGAKTL